MDAAKFVIVGGGMVAGYAAKQMVELGLKPGELAILSADNSVPYERPPLSKGFVPGKETEEGIRFNGEDFCRNHGIELKRGCEVSINCNRKRLNLKSGAEFGFEKLIIATGAHPRTLEVPGAKLQQVFYLRSMENSKSIRRAAERAKRAVTIGGGFIGMEVAPVLAQRNIEVTMVLNQDRIWKRLSTREMSELFEDYYSSRGGQFCKHGTVTELRGEG